jgi:glycerate-2-kinase
MTCAMTWSVVLPRRQTDSAFARAHGVTVSGAVLARQQPGNMFQRGLAAVHGAACGDLFETGPTGTNVMDVVIGLKPATGNGA